MKKVEERDHIDAWLETAWLQDIPNLDFAVCHDSLAFRFRRMENCKVEAPIASDSGQKSLRIRTSAPADFNA